MPIARNDLNGFILNNNDVIWVSPNVIEAYSPVIVGEYYCVNKNGNLEFYEDQQPIYNNKLFVLLYPTFVDNENRKWYQFWKPSRIIDGYAFECIDLEVRYED